MNRRRTWRTLALVLIGALLISPLSALAAAPAKPLTGKNFLRNIPVTGTLDDGGTFKGRLTITEFDYDTAKGLTVSGIVMGRATDADGKSRMMRQMFADVPTTLNESTASALGASTQQEEEGCQILFLDLGPIFLDLLGLQLDLSRIVLDLTAVPGAGNLLGNLLCAVAGLLDPGGFLPVLGDLLEQLTALLEQINDLIGQFP